MWWEFMTPTSFNYRLLVGIPVFLLIGVGLPEGLRWVSNREAGITTFELPKLRYPLPPNPTAAVTPANPAPISGASSNSQVPPSAEANPVDPDLALLKEAESEMASLMAFLKGMNEKRKQMIADVQQHNSDPPNRTEQSKMSYQMDKYDDFKREQAALYVEFHKAEVDRLRRELGLKVPAALRGYNGNRQLLIQTGAEVNLTWAELKELIREYRKLLISQGKIERTNRDF
jgi:hypothetical protein